MIKQKRPERNAPDVYGKRNTKPMLLQEQELLLPSVR